MTTAWSWNRDWLVNQQLNFQACLTLYCNTPIKSCSSPFVILTQHLNSLVRFLNSFTCSQSKGRIPLFRCRVPSLQAWKQLTLIPNAYCNPTLSQSMLEFTVQIMNPNKYISYVSFIYITPAIPPATVFLLLKRLELSNGRGSKVHACKHMATHHPTKQ